MPGQAALKNEVISSSDPRVLDIFGVGESMAAGQVVNERSAMRLSAVHACVRVISESISILPLHLYQEVNDERVKDKTNPLRKLFNLQVTARFSAAAFWIFCLKSKLLRGDGFAYIRRNLRGQVLEVIPLHPDCVIVERKGDRLVYYINDDGRYFGVEQEDMLHFPGLGFDGVRSESVVSHYARIAIGGALAADMHAAEFFGKGTMQRFALEQKGKITPEALESLRSQWVNTYGGSKNSNKPLVLTEGTQVKELSMSAADAQLLESRGFSVSDIARFFGVPGHMIGHTEKTTSWGSGIEQMSVGFVTYTLQPHLTSIAQELNRKLFPNEERFFEFEVKGLLRGDSKAQSEFFRSALGGSSGPAWMTVNEVRKLNNLQQVDGGDELVTWERSGSDGADSGGQAAADDGSQGSVEDDGQDEEVMTINERRNAAGLGPIEGGDRLVNEPTLPASAPVVNYRYDEVLKKVVPV